jgi:hypothetical protein
MFEGLIRGLLTEASRAPKNQRWKCEGQNRKDRKQKRKQDRKDE